MKKQWKWLILFMTLLFLPPVAAEAKTSARSALNEAEKAIYDILKPQIEEVARNGGSTHFKIPADKFDYRLINNGNFTEGTMDAINSHVADALLLDMPFEVYWYYNSPGYGYTPLIYEGKVVAVDPDSIFFEYSVAPEYQDGQQYTVSKNAALIASEAKRNAQYIVAKYAQKSDYEKLLGYKNEICNLAGYDYELAKTKYSLGSLNIVHIFDGDDATKSVCDAYASAFSYLCGLSNFQSDKIECRKVRRSGIHAWNLVTMEDGKNYLVDVTNCDEPSAPLFLRGAAGSPGAAYVITGANEKETFRYEYSQDLWMYSAAELTLSETDYNMFTDVKPDSAFLSAIQWAVVRGITNGTSDTTFSPGNTCTTANIITFLWRANGSPAPSGANPFSDVPSGAYYEKAAVWAYEKGLVSGKAFNGNSPCTRAATMKYLWILAGRPTSRQPPFADVAPDADYAQAISWAVAKGVTNGTSETTFSPDNACTRGQIAAFLYRHYAQ